ncbi:MAG: hypothetical protein CO093_08555 [Alphaproteobacteria bacterium CG_4_9_14_3_um_filter_47_13]|nr:MAG: hypothetical protein CO093_08555 [Alphaproteobacteria bacterium CG_4_9_14_3_um_filter_47_13]
MKYDLDYLSPQGGGTPFKYLSAFIGCLILEFLVWVLFYGVYTDTIGILSDVYLSELAGIGFIFSLIDDEMTVSHLLAGILAFFSCATPIYIWNTILQNNIHHDPQAWLSKPLNQIYAVLAAFLFILVFAVEVVNLYTLIAQSENTSPFYNTGTTSAFMGYLAQNKGLGIFVSFLMAIINAVIALITAKTAHQFKQAWKE